MKKESFIVYIGLGSNLGDRLENLKKALNHISALKHCSLIKFSSVYETPPLGIQDQHDFYNIVAKFETSIVPIEFIKALKRIETDMGRPKNYIKWGPRIIDCDILFVNDLVISHHDLTIPHPELQNRKFVLVPLLELENIQHPTLNCSVEELLNTTSDQSSIRNVATINLA